VVRGLHEVTKHPKAVSAQAQNSPFQVLLNADSWSLHGVELGDLSGVGPSNGNVGQDETVQDCRENANDGESLRALLRRRLHDDVFFFFLSWEMIELL
jgi:hypothetical protein